MRQEKYEGRTSNWAVDAQFSVLIFWVLLTVWNHKLKMHRKLCINALYSVHRHSGQYRRNELCDNMRRVCVTAAPGRDDDQVQRSPTNGAGTYAFSVL